MKRPIHITGVRREPPDLDRFVAALLARSLRSCAEPMSSGDYARNLRRREELRNRELDGLRRSHGCIGHFQRTACFSSLGQRPELTAGLLHELDQHGRARLVPLRIEFSQHVPCIVKAERVACSPSKQVLPRTVNGLDLFCRG